MLVNDKKTNKKKLVMLGIAFLTAVLIITVLLYTHYFNSGKPKNIDDFFAQFFIDYSSLDPELITSYGNMEAYGLKSQDDKLTDISDETLKETYEMFKKSLATLQSYDKSTLTPEQVLNAEILEWFLVNKIEGEKFAYHEYLVEPIWGVQNDLMNFMTGIHEIRDVTDAKNYITRLSQVDTKFDQLIDRVKISEKKGIIPSKQTLTTVINQIYRYMNQRIVQSPLYTNFKEKVDNLDISSDEKLELYSLLEKELTDTVFPSYKKLNAYLKELQTKATINAGVWELPNGDEYYQYKLKQMTSTNLTPEEIHNIGLSEVKRIQNEMNVLFDELGIEGNTIEDKNNKLYRLCESYKDESAFEKYQQCMDEMEEYLPKIFDVLPKLKIKLERVPDFNQAAGLNYYRSSSMDGSREGAFFVNLSYVHPEYCIKPLTYHESIPGHHLQIQLEEELDIPTFRKILRFESFMEGWALYAEKLAGEYGFYDTPESRLGYLQSELYRAVRLVVDTGIHFKKWSRQEAVNYFFAATGDSDLAVREVDRYIVWPGQACAYKIGKLKMLELRDKVKTALGDDFDIKEFHNLILQNGSMPLEVLEKQVDRYILSRK